MTAAKAKGLKTLIGKPVMLKNRYERDAEGPYILADLDPPFIAILYPDKNRTVWFHCNLIETLTEVTPSA